jgi:prepilin-type N-terminal cleavage/methylation domain-containing protein
VLYFIYKFMKSTLIGVKKNLSLLKGFTLIELMVAVSIIVILSSVIAISATTSNQQGRDAKRQSDLRSLQAAVELYKQRNGRYPAGCVPASAAANGWSGQQGTDYACAGGSNEYIVGLAPEFIKVLPFEKKLNGTNSGYVYRTNTDGTVYKIKAMRTVEADVIDYTHEFKACDIRVSSNEFGGLSSGSTQREVIGWCGRVHPSNDLPLACNVTNDQWNKSYAVWGGFAALRATPADPSGTVPSKVQDTTDVICQ